MGFNAAAVVEPLDWDFSGVNGMLPTDKGTIPEPTDADIEKLFQDVAALSNKLLKDAGLEQKEATPEELIIALADLPEGSEVGIRDVLKGMSQLFADLCKNQPNLDQLTRLPMRIRMRFFVWLAKELRPEDFGAAS